VKPDEFLIRQTETLLLTVDGSKLTKKVCIRRNNEAKHLFPNITRESYSAAYITTSATLGGREPGISKCHSKST
jgi:hypothetical protein